MSANQAFLFIFVKFKFGAKFQDFLSCKLSFLSFAILSMVGLLQGNDIRPKEKVQTHLWKQLIPNSNRSAISIHHQATLQGKDYFHGFIDFEFESDPSYKICITH